MDKKIKFNTMKDIIILITIASFAFAIIYQIAIFLGKTWGLEDKEQAGGIGLIILAISCFVIYKYESKGFILFSTVLLLIFLTYKHFSFQISEKIKIEEDRKYRLIIDQYIKGISNIQIASVTKFSIEYVNETIRKSEFEKEIAYHRPELSINELALKYDLPIEYVEGRYNLRFDKSDEGFEKIDPILTFYFLISIFIGFMVYIYVDISIKSDFLSYITGGFAFGTLFGLSMIGYFKNNFVKNILTWIAFGSFIFLIFYQIYLWA